MLKNAGGPENLQSLLLGLLSTSGTLAGLSMALVGIVNLKVANSKIETIADDIFFVLIARVLVSLLSCVFRVTATVIGKYTVLD